LWLRAEQQTGGRGRHGRRWEAGPGNLYASTLVRPRAGDPSPATLALVAGVALDQLVSAYAGEAQLRLKWPNDVLLDGAKLSGILLEGVAGAVVIGFGVNLAHHPEGIGRTTMSLAAAGIDPPDPALFATDLAEAFGEWLARWRGVGLEPIRSRWLERAHPIGTPLATTAPDGSRIEGLFDGLDPSGALRLRLADGAVHVMHAGDIDLI